MLKHGLLLTTSNVLAAALRMGRNIVIARLITVEDFGIASTFAMAMGLVETMSYIGLERLIIQARDGGEPSFLATVNAAQAIRGMFGAAVLFFSAGPIASIFGIPNLTWAYRATAIIPLLSGLNNLDIYRQQREMHFWPFVQTDLTSLLLSIAVTIPFAFVFGDYRIMLFSLLVQQLVFTLTSHAIATRPYRWAWNRDVARRAFEYGWPLLLASLVAFATLNCDRIIVGSLIGLKELGWFSAGSTLTMAPALVIASTLVTFFMPQLSRSQDSRLRFHQVYLVAVQCGMLAGLFLAVAFAIAGPAILNILYGAKYAAATSILVLIAVAQAVRIGTAAMAVTAMSKGNTGIPLLANVVRLLVLPGAWLLALNGIGVDAVVAIGIVGEVLSFAASVYLLCRRMRLPLVGLKLPCALSFGTLVLACVGGYFRSFVPIADGDSYSISASLIMPASLVLALLLTGWSMQAARKFGLGLLRNKISNERESTIGEL